MAKIACAAWGFRQMSWEDYCRVAAAMGITYLEIQLPHHLALGAGEAEMEAAKRMAREAGVRIVAIAGSSDFTSAAPAALEEAIGRAQRQVDLAARLDAEVVRLFTGGLAWECVPPEVYTRLHYALDRIGDYAQAKGVTVAIENHGGVTADGGRIARLMRGVHNKAVGINYDAANFLKIGVDPLIALRQIIPWVNYSHWKDVRWANGDTAYCALGEGEVQWVPIVRELERAGYQGYWAIEYEASEDIERGTRDSLTHLRHLVEKL